VVVASDSVDADDTQKALYFLAVPHGVELSCLKLAEAAKEWKSARWKNDRVLVLVSTPEDTLALFEAGAPMVSVNLGGLHFQRIMHQLQNIIPQKIVLIGVVGVDLPQHLLKYGADPKRIYRVPYWPDFDAFTSYNDVALERLQRKFGLDRDRRYIMYSGRLVPEKRVDLLIDAFVAIAAERPDWDLLIVGHGPLSDELRRRVPEALRRRVVWTGFLEGTENVLAFHAADMLVLPSDQEPWALVVQEAMAAGLVVVASNIVGAAHELVEDRVSGRIFAAGNLQQITLIRRQCQVLLKA